MNVRVGLFGGVRLGCGDSVVDIAPGRQRSVLALLACSRREVSTDELIDRIWVDNAGTAVRKNVQVQIGSIRRLARQLGAIEDIIDTTDHGYRLASCVEVDVAEFERRARSVARATGSTGPTVAQEAQAAMALWHGAPFGGESLEPWAAAEIRHLEELRLKVLSRGIDAALSTGAHKGLVSELDALVELHPHRADFQRMRIISMYRSGRQVDALDACRDALEIGTDGDDGIRQLERSLLNHDPALSVDAPASASPPAPPFRIIGRDDEVDQVKAALAPGVVVTLTGPGGAGKTRLANEVARTGNQGFADVAWIDMLHVRDETAVLPFLMSVLGVTSGEDEPLASIVQAIGPREILVVFDNFEHVLHAANVVEHLASHCPNASFLVTSRATLQVPSEREFVVRPLMVPHPLSSDKLLDAPAVQLFIERAAAAGGQVRPHVENLQAVAAVCAAVDGLPLGIELAAARASLLTPTEILERLDQRFDLLKHRSASHDDRQRSLHGVIAWSYDMLSEVARRTFRATSTFHGGCRHADLGWVAEVDGADLDRAVAELTRNNLLAEVVDELGEPRLTMLETISEFGQRRLEDDPAERASLRRQHAFRFLDVVAIANGPGDPVAEQRVAIERSNWLAAFDWACDHEPDVAARLFTSLDRHLHTRGSWHDGASLAERSLAALPAVTPELHAQVRALAGRAFMYRGDDARGKELYERAVSDARDSGDDRTELQVLLWEAERTRLAGESQRAIKLAAACADRAAAAGLEWHHAWAITQHGFALTDLERPLEAKEKYQEARAKFLELGDEYWAFNVEANLITTDLHVTDDQQIVDRLGELSSRLAELGYATYSAHVGAFELRGALEFGRWDVAAQVADDLIDRVRTSGESILLVYVLACASIAYLETRRLDDALNAAWESTELAVRSQRVMFTDYSIAVLACASAKREPGFARECIDAIDIEQLDGIFRLDRHLVERISSLGIDTSPIGPDKLSRVAAVVARGRPAPFR